MLARPFEKLQVIGVIDKAREIGVFVINREHEAPFDNAGLKQGICPKADSELSCDLRVSVQEKS